MPLETFSFIAQLTVLKELDQITVLKVTSATGFSQSEVALVVSFVVQFNNMYLRSLVHRFWVHLFLSYFSN